MVRGDLVAMLGQTLGVKAHDIEPEAERAAEPWGNGDILAGSPLQCLLAPGHWHPHGWVWLLQGTRPDSDILEGPEGAMIRQNLFGPGSFNDFPGLLKTPPRLLQADIVRYILAWDTARKAGDNTSPREAVEHR